MSWPSSNCSSPAYEVSSPEHRSSEAYESFHPLVQRWIHRQGWHELRPIQERAAAPILSGEKDVILSAATAGGKTEAAFLPIASAVAADWTDEELDGVSVLYVSPLKALINDQFERLEPLFEPLHVPVYRWHGDVSSDRKRDARDEGGLLLITPESMEARFIRQGWELANWFAPLRYVVVDELHAFIGTERGRQLQSILHRVEMAVGRRLPRIALSATLGDFSEAGEFLRPGGGEDVEVVASEGERQTVRLQVRGYEERPPPLGDDDGGEASDREVPIDEIVAGDHVDIARHLYKSLRGGRHLVFANRRRDVEMYSDLLRRLCEKDGRRNEFFPHHGSLSRTLREDAEERLRKGDQPTTIIATTTLELGIDVGAVETIAQIGPPPSVASMRQRLGRSGRRGDPAVLRVYVREPQLESDSAPQDRLRTRLVRTAAMVELLADRWYEPPVAGALHLSTLVQQSLSLIAQFGELDARVGYRALCSDGPFRAVRSDQYRDLLHDLGRHELIKQERDGSLVLDLDGERLVDHYEFYAAFTTPDEYRLVANGESIGSLPIAAPLTPGISLIFGGRRWRVVSVREEEKVIELESASGGRPPSFLGSGGPEVAGEIRQKMKEIYRSGSEPSYLSPGGQALLRQGRGAYRDLELDERSLLPWGKDSHYFPWIGDRGLNVLVLECRHRGLEAGQEGPALRMAGLPPNKARGYLEEIRATGLSPADDLAMALRNKRVEKHHRFLREELLAADYASRRLDVEEAAEALSA